MLNCELETKKITNILQKVKNSKEILEISSAVLF